MITDRQLTLSSAQVVESTEDSTNVINSGAAGNLAGHILVAYVGTAFDTLTSLQVSLQSSADNSTYVQHALTPAILLASIDAAGDAICAIRIPEGVRQYVKAKYIVVGSANVAGTVYAYILPDGGDSAFSTATIAA